MDTPTPTPITTPGGPTTPPPALLSIANILKGLRSAIGDFNYWGQSEGDSPLVVRRATKWTEAQLVSADTSMRKKTGGEGYVVPPKEGRGIVYKTIDEVFQVLVRSAVAELNTAFSEFGNASFSVDGFRRATEILEYYTQLWSIWKSIPEAKIAYVDYPNDPFVGLFIYGQVEGAFVICQACLVQT